MYIILTLKVWVSSKWDVPGKPQGGGIQEALTPCEEEWKLYSKHPWRNGAPRFISNAETGQLLEEANFSCLYRRFRLLGYDPYWGCTI